MERILQSAGTTLPVFNLTMSPMVRSFVSDSFQFPSLNTTENELCIFLRVSIDSSAL